MRDGRVCLCYSDEYELLGTSNSFSATKVVELEVYPTARDLKYSLLPDMVAYYL